ncbi:ATP-binding protein [Streptomyces sp. NBC_00209]|uniref:ATP-binding protein n=1 Tax=Streptomyces sp. NBC_00209 TaxID=2975682 RepID=UPI003254C60E
MLPADYSALAVTRIEGRTRLTVLGWTGRQHAAVDVLYVLVRNALDHGTTPAAETIGVRLVVTSSELLIDVSDSNPEFPEFERAVRGELGRGLWAVRNTGAVVTFLPSDKGDGKVVRATLRTGPVEP